MNLRKRRVLHGDKRKEIVLVLGDESVRIIDFDNAPMLPEDDLGPIMRKNDEIMVMRKELKNDCGAPARNGNSHWSIFSFWN